MRARAANRESSRKRKVTSATTARAVIHLASALPHLADLRLALGKVRQRRLALRLALHRRPLLLPALEDGACRRRLDACSRLAQQVALLHALGPPGDPLAPAAREPLVDHPPHDLPPQQLDALLLLLLPQQVLALLERACQRERDLLAQPSDGLRLLDGKVAQRRLVLRAQRAVRRLQLVVPRLQLLEAARGRVLDFRAVGGAPLGCPVAEDCREARQAQPARRLPQLVALVHDRLGAVGGR
eukprot:5837919-Prymnesium_polylepis.2